MKNYKKEQLEASRPDGNANDNIEHCLSHLYAERIHRVSDCVAHELTYEELIGTLLQARDELKQYVEASKSMEELS